MFYNQDKLTNIMNQNNGLDHPCLKSSIVSIRYGTIKLRYLMICKSIIIEMNSHRKE